MIEAGKSYVGKVVPGAGLIEAGTGTVGFAVPLEAPEGTVEYVIWITERNKDKATHDFKTLGCDPARLNDPAYIDSLPELIVGREVPFATKLDEYQGKARVKVSYIGDRTAKKASPEAAKTVAAMFGGATTPDPDIPF